MKVRQNSVDKGMLSKNVFRMVISLALLVLCLVIGEVSGGRIATADDYQYAIWPFSGSVVFSQTYGPQTPNHHCGNVIDVSNTDAYAPFDCYCIDIRSQGSGNQVLFQSANPVHLADGSIQIVKISFAHDENISDCITWKNNHTLIPQGTKIYSPGNSGNSSGAHIHAMFGVTEDCGYETMYCGKTSSCNSIKDKPGYEWRLNHTMDWNQAFFLCKDAPFNSYESNFDFTTHNIIKKDMVTNFRNLIPGRQLNIVFDNGQVTGAQSGDYIEIGSQVSLTATPLSGYTFTGWTITSGNVITENSNNPYSFTMPENDLTIEANFKIISNTVVKRWKNVSANASGSTLSMIATLEIDAATLLGVEMPHIVTYPRILVSTSQGLGNPYSKYYDTPQDEVTTINGGKRHRYTFSLNNVSELVNDAGQSLQLLPGTVYYYRWMAVINDNLYTSELYSFTARNPLVTWSDLCTNGGKYSGLFNGVVRWDKSLSMQEVGCFVSTNRDAVSGASRQNHNGCAFKNDTTIKMDSSVTTDAANGTWVFYKGPSFDTITSFASNTTYYYKFYAYTSDNAETFSEIMPYTPDGDTTKPQIVSASVGNITEYGYDVYVTATDNVAVKHISIGTWHDNMHVDNAVWQEKAVDASGSATLHVDISSFGNAQNVTYHTNVYAVDTAGNVSEGIRAGDPYVQADTNAPLITSASVGNITENGYDVYVKATDNGSLSYIRIGTWHDNMSIDNAVWQNQSIDASGAATIHVNISDFENTQNVTYHSNAYAVDAAGNVSDVVRAGDPYVKKETFKLLIQPEFERRWGVYGTSINFAKAGVVHLSDYPISLTDEEIEKYEFDHWESDDVIFVDPYDENTTFTMPYSDTSITKVYKPKPTAYINLTIIATAGGTISFHDMNDNLYEIKNGSPFTISICMDERISLTAFEDKYYVFSGWETTSSWLEDVNNPTYNNISAPDQNMTLHAVFVPGPYLIDESKAFYLPSGLTEIEEEAFAGVSARYFVIPATVTAIGANAFPEGSFVYLQTKKIQNLSKEVITDKGVFIETGSADYDFAEALKDTSYDYVNEYGTSMVHKKTQYRYRTKETTTSNQSTLSGWTLYDEQTGAWGAWISNGTTPVTASADVEVNPIYHAEQTGITGYNYHRFRYTNSNGSVMYTYSESYATSHGGYRENNSVTAVNRLPLYKVYDGNQSYGVQYNFWFYEEPVTGVISPAYTEYQYRTRTRTYYFYRWSDWSDWQDEPVTENENIEVEIREI